MTPHLTPGRLRQQPPLLAPVITGCAARIKCGEVTAPGPVTVTFPRSGDFPCVSHQQAPGWNVWSEKLLPEWCEEAASSPAVFRTLLQAL